MRIGVLSWTRNRAGGAEYSIASALQLLAGQGHDLALMYEVAAPADRESLPLGDGIPSWGVHELGARETLARLRAWKPDVLLGNGVLDPWIEQEALRITPGALFAHGYYGTCVSGTKTFTFPHLAHCRHGFGWRCLFRYYPRRIGGWSPVKLAREYRRQARRLKALHVYRLILVHSEHMRSEYTRQGFTPHRITRLPFPPVELPSDAASLVKLRSRSPDEPWRLLFVGRMDYLKGGSTLLAALPDVARTLAARLELAMVGDGPMRARWENDARVVTAAHSGLKVRFHGWLSQREVQVFYRLADLLVMPSLWPEPFGRAGLEAAAYAVPCAAFAAGGIPEWLTDGINGTLAAADPPTPGGLAHAMVRALVDLQRHASLRVGALATARRAAAAPFTSALISALERAARMG